jgi:prepilin-type N-terminal cleavage/methylation domain-containing protein
MKKTNQKGFTIIELLVVIVIIGILVALALPQLFSAQARGRDTERKNDMKNLQQKLETYFNDHGNYPDQTSWTTDLSLNTDQWHGPKNDAYQYTSNGDTYTLKADLENDSDPDATDSSGTYVVKSVNE